MEGGTTRVIFLASKFKQFSSEFTAGSQLHSAIKINQIAD